MSEVASTRKFESCCGLSREDQLAIVFLASVCLLVAYLTRGHASVSEAVVIDSQIELNRATAAELDLLEGIGPKLSARILEDREARGPFKSVANLQRVKGIGPKTLEKNRAYLRVESAE